MNGILDETKVGSVSDNQEIIYCYLVNENLHTLDLFYVLSTGLLVDYLHYDNCIIFSRSL